MSNPKKKARPTPEAQVRPDPSLAEDLEDLLQKVVIEEASQAVWQQFEQALSQLDKESLDLLEGYLDGIPADKLGKNHKISPKQAGDLISQIKRDLSTHLKKNNPVRQ